MNSSEMLDPRRHAYRADLADARLKGLIEAERFVHGEARQVIAPALPLRREARFDSILETEALKGGLGHFEAVYLMPLALAHAERMGKFGA